MPDFSIGSFHCSILDYLEALAKYQIIQFSQIFYLFVPISNISIGESDMIDLISSIGTNITLRKSTVLVILRHQNRIYGKSQMNIEIPKIRGQKIQHVQSNKMSQINMKRPKILGQKR